MPRIISTLLVIFLLACSSVALAAEKQPRALPYQNGQASGWKAVISDYSHAPSFLIAVDKQDQQVSLFERKSPLTKIAEYTCTTGQNEGDKLLEGDLKTPEGIYFVVKHINSGLNFALYGYEAYPLNYPNPVDRLRKKTGYGIWIHGKGIPLVPFDSNGCVGMFNSDIATLKKKPMIGQPVTVAVDIDYKAVPDPQQAATASALAGKVEAWAKAWSNRSTEMFNFYDADSYSITQNQSFSVFKAQKEHLFKALPWINTTVSDIQVLEGPGYWVTWFNQDYKAPNLSSSGTRRLYWQQDQNGELRIVGMEWLNGLKSPVLYAENKPAATLSDATSTAKPAEKPTVVPQARPEPNKPVGSAAEQPHLVTQAKPVPKDERPSLIEQELKIAAAQKQADTKAATEAMLASEGREFIAGWQEAWKKQDATAYAKFYSDNAVQDNRKGVQTVLNQKLKIWEKSRVTRLDFSNVSIDTTDRGLKIVMRQDYSDSRGYADKGVKILYLEYNDTWRIVREDWKPLVTQ